jgi:hypothetical protein
MKDGEGAAATSSSGAPQRPLSEKKPSEQRPSIQGSMKQVTPRRRKRSSQKLRTWKEQLITKIAASRHCAIYFN